MFMETLYCITVTLRCTLLIWLRPLKKNTVAWFDRIVVQKIMDPHNWKEKSYSVGYNGNKMQDKPWLSSDNHSAEYNGNLYVTWTEFDKYGSDNQADRSRIRFSKYDPKSDSFSSAVTISDTTGDCLDSDNTLRRCDFSGWQKWRSICSVGWIRICLGR